MPKKPETETEIVVYGRPAPSESTSVKRKNIVATVMEDDGTMRDVEVDIEDRMLNLYLLMAPCSPTVH